MPFHARRLRVIFLLGALLLCVVDGCGKHADPGGTSLTSLSPSRPGVSEITPGSRVTPVLRSSGATVTPHNACASSDLSGTVATDRSSYRSGEPVVMTISVRNGSESRCTVRTGSCIPQVRIIDGSGAEIWNRATTQVLCAFDPLRSLLPGAVVTRRVIWDGRPCHGRTPAACQVHTAPPGTYRVTARWQDE